jgi:hypothetical protein
MFRGTYDDKSIVFVVMFENEIRNPDQVNIKKLLQSFSISLIAGSILHHENRTIPIRKGNFS